MPDVYTTDYLQLGAENIDASYTTPIMKMSPSSDQFGVHVHAPSDTHVGAITCQISNDPTQTYWVDVDFDDGTSEIDLASGAVLAAFRQVSDISCIWVRFVYTRTSGDGDLSLWCNVTKRR